MTASLRAWLCGGFGVLVAACSDPQNHANVPDQPSSPDGTPVIVLGRPTPKSGPSSEPIMVAGEDPEPAVIATLAPKTTNADADLAVLVRDPRKSRRFPRSTPLLISELQSLEALLASVPPTAPDRPRLLRRSGETYVELKNAARRDKQQSGRTSASGEMVRLDKLAFAAQKAAIKHYTEMVTKHAYFCQSPHPTDPMQSQGCIDDALYFLGLEFQEMDALQETRKYYLQLIKSFPNSKWIPYAYLGFGEFFFSEALGDPSKWDFAKKTYEEVLKFPPPENEAYGYAHYRLAQIFHQKQDEPTALAHFVQAIDFSTNFTGLQSSGPLGHAARRDIVSSYAAAGTPRKAEAFFKRLTNDPPGTNEMLVGMLDALVQVYLRENKRVEAGDVCYAFSGGASALASCRSIAPSAFQPKP